MVRFSTKVRERKKLIVLPITLLTLPDTSQPLLLLGIYLHVASRHGTGPAALIVATQLHLERKPVDRTALRCTLCYGYTKTDKHMQTRD